jgi:hypothetical protein
VINNILIIYKQNHIHNNKLIIIIGIKVNLIHIIIVINNQIKDQIKDQTMNHIKNHIKNQIMDQINNYIKEIDKIIYNNNNLE